MMELPYDTSNTFINYFDLFDRTGDSAFLKKALFLFLDSELDVKGNCNRFEVITCDPIDDFWLSVLKGYSKLGSVNEMYSTTALRIDVVKSLIGERSSEFLDKFVFNYSLENIVESVTIKKVKTFRSDALEDFVRTYSDDVKIALTSMAYGSLDLSYYIYSRLDDDFIHVWEYDGKLSDFKPLFSIFGSESDFVDRVYSSVYGVYQSIMFFSKDDVRGLLGRVYRKIMEDSMSSMGVF